MGRLAVLKMVNEMNRSTKCGNCGALLVGHVGEAWCPRCRFKVIDSSPGELAKANAGFITWDGKTL